MYLFENKCELSFMLFEILQLICLQRRIDIGNNKFCTRDIDFLQFVVVAWPRRFELCQVHGCTRCRVFDLSQLSCQVTACSCERFQRIMPRRVCFFGFRQVVVQFKSFALFDF